MSKRKLQQTKRKVRKGTIVSIFGAALITAGSMQIIQTEANYRRPRDEYQILQAEYLQRSKSEAPKDHSDNLSAPKSSRNDSTKPVYMLQDSSQQLCNFKEMYGALPQNAPDAPDVCWTDLKLANSDIVGWIEIPDLNISYPVMQYTDNDFYLHRSFSKTDCYSGSIFLDYRCDAAFLGYHTVLYGHNMRDGSMFASLKAYQDPVFQKEHPYFWLLTPDSQLLYRITAVRICEADSEQYHVTFCDSHEYKEWLSSDPIWKQVQTTMEAAARMLHLLDTEARFQPEKLPQIATLSTCTENGKKRLLVQGCLIYQRTHR